MSSAKRIRIEPLYQQRCFNGEQHETRNYLRSKTHQYVEYATDLNAYLKDEGYVVQRRGDRKTNVVVLGKFEKHKPVVAKVYFERRHKHHHMTAGEHEALFYEQVIDKCGVVGFLTTPHFLAFYKKVKISNFHSALNRAVTPSRLTTNILQILSQVQHDIYNTERANALFIERCDYSLQDWIYASDRFRDMLASEHWSTVESIRGAHTEQASPATEAMNDDSRQRHIFLILFQICYHLHVMQQLGIAHNDLKSDNILLIDLGYRWATYYYIGGHVYKLRIRYLVKFFDWGVSSKFKTKYSDFVLREKHTFSTYSTTKMHIGNYRNQPNTYYAAHGHFVPGNDLASLVFSLISNAIGREKTKVDILIDEWAKNVVFSTDYYRTAERYIKRSPPIHLHGLLKPVRFEDDLLCEIPTSATWAGGLCKWINTIENIVNNTPQFKEFRVDLKYIPETTCIYRAPGDAFKLSRLHRKK